MAFCTKCGTQIPDDAKICPACGAPAAEETAAEFKASEKSIKVAEKANDITMGAFAYLGPLVFIPYFFRRDKELLIYHSRQGFTLFLLYAAALVATIILSALSAIPYVGILFLILSFGGYALLVFCEVLTVLGIINVVKKKCAPLPVIGKIDALKWFKK